MRSGFQKNLASCVWAPAANLHGAIATLDEIAELIADPTALAPSSIAEGRRTVARLGPRVQSACACDDRARGARRRENGIDRRERHVDEDR